MKIKEHAFQFFVHFFDGLYRENRSQKISLCDVVFIATSLFLIKIYHLNPTEKFKLMVFGQIAISADFERVLQEGIIETKLN